MSTRYWIGFLSTAMMLGNWSWCSAQGPAPGLQVDCRKATLTSEDGGKPQAESDEERPQVAIELRLLSVPESFLQRIGADYFPRTQAPAGEADNPRVAFLSDAQVLQFMEAAQGNAYVNVMQAPKVTLFDAQASVLDIGETRYFVTGVDVRWNGKDVVALPHNEPCQLGLHVELQPEVSADRRFIRLKVKAKDTCLASAVVPLSPVTSMVTPFFENGSKGRPVPFTQYIQQPVISSIGVDETLSLPDGGTALLYGGKRQSEAANQFGPPVLSKIPYISQLFKDSRNKDTQCVLFMVTPRLLVAEAEETAVPTRQLEP